MTENILDGTTAYVSPISCIKLKVWIVRGYATVAISTPYQICLFIEADCSNFLVSVIKTKIRLFQVFRKINRVVEKMLPIIHYTFTIQKLSIAIVF